MRDCAVLAPTTRCYGCGVSLAQHSRSHHHPLHTKYCSRSCMLLAPPKLVRAMRERGVRDPRVCIVGALNEARSIGRAAGLLGVTHYTLARWIKRHGVREEVRWS